MYWLGVFGSDIPVVQISIDAVLIDTVAHVAMFLPLVLAVSRATTQDHLVLDRAKSNPRAGSIGRDAKAVVGGNETKVVSQEAYMFIYIYFFCDGFAFKAFGSGFSVRSALVGPLWLQDPRARISCFDRCALPWFPVPLTSLSFNRPTFFGAYTSPLVLGVPAPSSWVALAVLFFVWTDCLHLCLCGIRCHVPSLHFCVFLTFTWFRSLP